MSSHTPHWVGLGEQRPRHVLDGVASARPPLPSWHVFGSPHQRGTIPGEIALNTPAPTGPGSGGSGPLRQALTNRAGGLDRGSWLGFEPRGSPALCSREPAADGSGGGLWLRSPKGVSKKRSGRGGQLPLSAAPDGLSCFPVPWPAWPASLPGQSDRQPHFTDEGLRLRAGGRAEIALWCHWHWVPNLPSGR